MPKKIFIFWKVFSPCAACIVFLITLEFAARVDDKIKYAAPLFATYNSNRLRSTDLSGIRYNVPNSHFEKWKINSVGFRGKEIPLAKPGGTKRVVCLGTSETFGLYEAPGNEWPEQLNSILKKTIRNYQIINASVVGMPLVGFIPYLERYVLKIQPDIIILCANAFPYAADIDVFLARQKEKPNLNKSNGRNSFKMMPFESRVLPKITQVVKSILPAGLVQGIQRWRVERQIRSLEIKRLKGRNPYDVVPSENIERFREDFEQLLFFLKQKGIKAIVCSYPTLISPETLTVQENQLYFLFARRYLIEFSYAGIQDTANKFNQAMELAAHEHGVGFIDLNAAVPKNSDYFADNVHYTDAGARRVAETIGTYITKHPDM